ncbi:MAG: immune inhibitor A, partial [Candidatus Eisenbacteria bacterium]|nr:immune inhibitor A [Candidatus Eisenbacteria bacterium]
YIVVAQGASSVGSIPPGESATLSPPFEVTVQPGAPSFHTVILDLAMTTDSGYQNAGEALALVVGGGELEEDFEGSGSDWSHYNVTSGFLDQWHVETYRYSSSSHSWKSGGSGSADYANSSDGVLETPTFCIGHEAELTFWSWLAAEEESPTSAWDCALVEVSTDDGDSWSTLIPVGGYSHTKNDNEANPLPQGTPCWSGSHGWREEVFDLTPYEGDRATFRFRFVSDAYVTDEGWYVDDISLTSTSTGAESSDGQVAAFALFQNAPNPFNPVTTIGYALPEPARVSIEIYNVAGRKVATLVDGPRDAGTHTVTWDGRNSRGQELGSGVYFCRMAAGRFTERRVMVLLK